MIFFFKLPLSNVLSFKLAGAHTGLPLPDLSTRLYIAGLIQALENRILMGFRSILTSSGLIQRSRDGEKEINLWKMLADLEIRLEDTFGFTREQRVRKSNFLYDKSCL